MQLRYRPNIPGVAGTVAGEVLSKLPSVQVAALHGTNCVAEVSSPTGLSHTKSCDDHKDDSARIQAAIDQVSSLPLKSAADGQHFRGRVKLGPGTFFVSSSLRIRHSGVILEGAGGHCRANAVAEVGDPKLCTTIVAEGALDSVVTLGLDKAAVREVSGRDAWRSAITQSYVPVGATTVTVKNASGFSVGDRVVVERKSTKQWLDALGMTTLVKDHKAMRCWW